MYIFLVAQLVRAHPFTDDVAGSIPAEERFWCVFIFQGLSFKETSIKCGKYEVNKDQVKKENQTRLCLSYDNSQHLAGI